MQQLPELRDAAAFAGEWRLLGKGVDCTVVLSATRVESANAHSLADPAGCLSRLLGRAAAGWRPASDGLDMAGADRSSIGFFSFERDGSSTLTRNGDSYRLARSP